jgi:DNA polymerase V
MIALVDCNNFYASCERVFRPDLAGKPIVVLSNNDGCVIARSAEAKALDIPMGIPAYQVEPLVQKYGVHVFSSNYALYGDMSRRVMATLSMFTPEIEVYSIDEAFLNFDGLDFINLPAYSREIVQKTTQYTGIPISIGVGPTKTLAKVANRLAKKTPHTKGAWVIPDDALEIADVLKQVEIGEVWGIGRSHKNFLQKHGVETAYDFTQKPREWVSRNMKVVGLRTWEELRGRPCIGMEEELTEKQNICTSRSFGELLNDYNLLEEAVTYYATTCAAKLRQQKSFAGTVYVFAYTHPNRQDLPQYKARMWYALPTPTNSTLDIVKHALHCLRTVYKKKDRFGRPIYYKNAGVIVSGIVPEGEIQGNIFSAPTDKKHLQLMAAVDRINNLVGREKVTLATQGSSTRWKLRCEKLSNRYTTRLDQVVEIE